MEQSGLLQGVAMPVRMASDSDRREKLSRVLPSARGELWIWTGLQPPDPRFLTPAQAATVVEHREREARNLSEISQSFRRAWDQRRQDLEQE